MCTDSTFFKMQISILTFNFSVKCYCPILYYTFYYYTMVYCTLLRTKGIPEGQRLHVFYDLGVKDQYNFVFNFLFYSDLRIFFV